MAAPPARAERNTARADRNTASVVPILGNEAAKGLRITWSHRVTLIPQLLMILLMYSLLQLVIGAGEFVDELVPLTLFAYLSYMVGYITVLKVVSGLLEEVNTGTLEQTHLTPVRPEALLAGRLGAALVEALLTALVAGVGLILALDIDVPLRPAALVPFALTIADIAGFGMLMAGLALVVNAIGAILHVIQMLILMLNGALIPVTAFPHGLEVAAKFVPTALGGDATRRILFDGESLAAAWNGHSLQWAFLHAVVMLAAGWVVYRLAVRRGLRDGRLGP